MSLARSVTHRREDEYTQFIAGMPEGQIPIGGLRRRFYRNMTEWYGPD
jgi:hypothetical protein